MQSSHLKTLVIEALEELKGREVVACDVSEMTTVTDYMIVVSGTSSRHVASLAENVVLKCKEKGIKPIGVEGISQSEWVLVDLGDVVVHVMQSATRQFYDLQRLWEKPTAISSTITTTSGLYST